MLSTLDIVVYSIPLELTVNSQREFTKSSFILHNLTRTGNSFRVGSTRPKRSQTDEDALTTR